MEAAHIKGYAERRFIPKPKVAERTLGTARQCAGVPQRGTIEDEKSQNPQKARDVRDAIPAPGLTRSATLPRFVVPIQGEVIFGGLFPRALPALPWAFILPPFRRFRREASVAN